ncbi:ribbon-helix-helix domain-containing protein [Limnospira platensis CENA597]|uniref:ribbon-helix-helix domain-containing protein n=1 Tax=Limnospira platensis TaxID=118562 RepID=UPI003D6E11C2
MNLSLTPEIEQRIADQLNPGHDQSTHEVILAALELLDQHQQYLSELRQEIAMSATPIEQGQVIDGEVVCDRIFNGLHHFSSTR